MSSVAVLGFLGAIVFLVITPGASLTMMVQKTWPDSATLLGG
jgi:hypothetical protein